MLKTCLMSGKNSGNLSAAQDSKHDPNRSIWAEYISVASADFLLYIFLKGLVHDKAHARPVSLQNKFVGSTLNSKSPLPVQSLKILRFIRTSVPLAGLVILQ